MKKVIMLTSVLLCFTCLANAYKNEYIDSRHNFNTTKRIFIEFQNDPSIDQFSINKSYKVYEEKIIKGLLPELRRKGVSVSNIYDLANKISQDTGMNIFYVYQSNPQYANQIKNEYLIKNFDAVWTFNLTSQDVGKDFIPGHTITLPTTERAHYNARYNTPYGPITQHGNITYHGYRDHYIPDKYAPAPFCTVRITMTDLHSRRIIWDRIDSRRRSNDSIFSNSMPEDLYRRIITAYANDARGHFNLK